MFSNMFLSTININIRMNLDIVSIIYLFIRISPLLVVSHFVLQSILNTDSKGMIYLTGLILTCLFNSVVGAALPPPKEIASANDIDCKSMALGNFPNVSISQVTLGFTYGYLMYIILYYAKKGETYVNSNLPTIILFPLLIFGNGFWNWLKGCTELSILLLSLVMGLGGGVGWAFMLKSANYKHLALFNGISNHAICSKPAKTKFKCVKGRNV